MAYARSRDGKPLKVGDAVTVVFEEGDVLESDWTCATCGSSFKSKITVIGSSFHREFPEGSCGCAYAP